MAPNFIERKVILPALRAALNITSTVALLVIGLALITAAYSFIAGSIAGGAQVAPPKVEVNALKATLSSPGKPIVRETIAAASTYGLDILSIEMGDDTDLQARVVEFATLADPSKSETYFAAYELAAASLTFAVVDEGAYSESSSKAAFIKGLVENFQNQQKSSPNIDAEKFVAAYVSAWISDGKAKVERYRRARAAANSHAESVNSSLIFAAFGLAAFISSALALALVLTERNTRGPGASRASGQGLDPKNLLIALAALSAASFLGPPLPASAQIQTQAQREALAAADLQRSKAAAKAKASKVFDSEMEARRAHIGKTYVFNPNGIREKDPGWNYSYYPYPRVFSQFLLMSCVRDDDCDLLTLEKHRVVTSSEPFAFEVKDIGSKLCGTRAYGLRDEMRETCYFYIVDIMGTPAALLIGWAEYSEFDEKWLLNGKCINFRTYLCEQPYVLIDPLAQTSGSPFIDGELRGYLTDMPEVITARLAEEEREAAARRAEAQREAAARRAEAQREAAAKKAAADSAAAKQREVDAQKARERKAQELVDKYGSAVATAILEKKVIVGMPQSAVVESWGEPQRRKLVPPDDEMWTYSSGKSVFFTKKKVTAIK
jgi:hypothetical protein